MKQNKKICIMLFCLIFAAISLIGCRNVKAPNATNTPIISPGISGILPSPIIPSPVIPSPILPTVSTTASPTTDVKTTASIVNNASAFEKAISKNGTWIIAILNDMNISKDLILEGEFKNNKNAVQRKVALYTQDYANKAVTARFTLTAPKLTIKSPNASIEHGTFKGDLYVEAKNFKLIDTKVDGNVYFLNNDAQSTFTMDAPSSITGKKELKK